MQSKLKILDEMNEILQKSPSVISFICYEKFFELSTHPPWLLPVSPTPLLHSHSFSSFTPLSPLIPLIRSFKLTHLSFPQ